MAFRRRRRRRRSGFRARFKTYRRARRMRRRRRTRRGSFRPRRMFRRFRTMRRRRTNRRRRCSTGGKGFKIFGIKLSMTMLIALVAGAYFLFFHKKSDGKGIF